MDLARRRSGRRSGLRCCRRRSNAESLPFVLLTGPLPGGTGRLFSWKKRPHMSGCVLLARARDHGWGQRLAASVYFPSLPSLTFLRVSWNLPSKNQSSGGRGYLFPRASLIGNSSPRPRHRIQGVCRYHRGTTGCSCQAHLSLQHACSSSRQAIQRPGPPPFGGGASALASAGASKINYRSTQKQC